MRQLTITDIKQAVKNIFQNKICKKLYLVITDILGSIILMIKTALIVFGIIFIAFILIFCFNPGLPGLIESAITNGDAVVFYRNNLPKHLTKKETRQVTELNSLMSKLNGESNSAVLIVKRKKETILCQIPKKEK
jgi:hypothetical protein